MLDGLAAVVAAVETVDAAEIAVVLGTFESDQASERASDRARRYGVCYSCRGDTPNIRSALEAT